ncbi:hypothetical protein [Saccharothrix syringae]|nr:hypothetical protein [Saccharothrix syringae]
MASKSKKWSVAPYVALFIAALILIPDLREPVFTVVDSLVEKVKDAFFG